MAYFTPIIIDDRVADEIKALVRARVKPYLHDVREMLRHPLTSEAPALNFSIALVLCSVVGGLARVFFNHLSGDRDSFLAVAQRYPFDAGEPGNAIRDPVAFAETLYETYRCNLVHSLGFNMLKDPDSRRWTVLAGTTRVKVSRCPNPPRTEEQLTELDAPEGWPAGLPATLGREEDGTLRLDVDALYCGVRRLVRVLAEDRALQPEAVNVLQKWISRAPGESTATMSTTRPEVMHTVVDQSANAASGASSEYRNQPKGGSR